MKSILVTGGAGFIGSHTVVELVAAGYQPIIIDNFINSDREVLSGIEKITGSKVICYEGNYQDKKLLAQIFKKYEVAGVIHFAALKAVNESIKQPLDYYKNNVAGLLELLETMEENNVSSLIFSSSATVYGEPDSLPLTEESPLKQPTSPYGATKQMGEQIISDTVKASDNLRAFSLRYFNPIGAHPSGLIGELPKGVPANLVPFLAQAAAGIREELTVFGDDYDTPDGTCIRDYIHVVDLAQAHIQALEFVINQPPQFYDVLNIGTGTGSSVLEVIKTFEEVTSKKVPHKIGPRRDGDVITCYAGVDKAKSVLNWHTQKSLSEGLADAWRWQESLAEK